VVEVFGVEGGAAEFDGGSEDGGVPVGDLAAALECEGVADEAWGWTGAGVGEEQFHGFRDGLAGLPEAPLEAACVDELLDYLEGECEFLLGQQPAGDAPLFLIFRSSGDGIDEDIGIEEDHDSGVGRGGMPLGLLPVEPADGSVDLNRIEGIQQGGGPHFPLAFGTGGIGFGRVHFPNQGLANEILEGGFSLDGRDFRPLDDFLGKINGGFHWGRNIPVNMACCQFSKPFKLTYLRGEWSGCWLLVAGRSFQISDFRVQGRWVAPSSVLRFLRFLL